MSITLAQAKEKLKKYGQEHVLKYYEELTEEERASLLDQIEVSDMEILESCRHQEELTKRGVITPLAAMELPEIEANRESFTRAGADAIRAGKVGAVLLAGGMGTRLGSDDPKGVYNIGITRKLYIFECLINNLMEIVKETEAWIPLFVMTSDKNHEATVKFLKEHDFFGYKAECVHFFTQKMALAVDYDGKVYMEGKGKMASSPNGNGGWFVSLRDAGLLDLIHRQGIEWLNVFAVDNVLQHIADPCFIGATVQRKCVAGAKVVAKVTPDEKVGAICLEDGRPSIVEYYDMTQELMAARDAQGKPAYNFGVILNYLFSVAELERVLSLSLPLHVVEKKIPYLDEAGELVKPEAPNGYKFENLILDMIYQMESCLPYEVVRENEFAPIKNKTGIDSVESARELLRRKGVVL